MGVIGERGREGKSEYVAGSRRKLERGFGFGDKILPPHTPMNTLTLMALTHTGQQVSPSAFDGSASMLAAIVGIAPCFTLIPVLFAAVPYGTIVVLWVMVSYAVATIVSMVILTNIALKAINFVTRFAATEKEIEILTGIVILGAGIWVLGEKYWLSLLGLRARAYA